MKGLGAQAANKANNAVESITTSVKEGVGSLTSTASAVADSINETAVRASTAQMCNILEIALEEVKRRPLSSRPISLTATVNVGITALEMQVHLDPSEGETGRGFEGSSSVLPA
jgi:hypothetical protein